MVKRYDASIKHMVELHPADWLAAARFPIGGSVTVIDADVSSISPAADKVLRIGGPDPYIGHLEFQANPDPNIDRRVLLYNVVLGWRHGLPVRSTVFLLRPEADAGASGVVRDMAADDAMLEFRYRLVRVWEQPAEFFLSGGLGTLPLAPVSAVAAGPLDAVRSVMSEVRKRIDRDATSREAPEIWTAVKLLLGLRFPTPIVNDLYSGVQPMRVDLSASSTYQEIVREGLEKGMLEGMSKGMKQGMEQGLEQGMERGMAQGRVQGARDVLLAQAASRFGVPPIEVRTAIQAISEMSRLESLATRVLTAESWQDLLKP